MTVLCSMSAAPVLAADVAWSKGDSWTYSFRAGETGTFDMNGSLEMKVSKTTSDSYVMALSGTATVSGSFENTSIEGTADISGSIIREKATFGAKSTTFIANVTTGVLGLWVEFGVTTIATPPLNDLPINRVLIPGNHIWSNTTVTGASWINMPLLGNDSSDISTTDQLELVVGMNETITTPAGTFECVKLSTGPGPGALTYYYSEKVGNYVKVIGSGGTDVGFGALGNLTLESYSYGKGRGIMSFVTGENWWVTALIIAVIVVFVVVLLVLRRRGRTSQMAPPPV